jgi:hypothetical protein
MKELELVSSALLTPVAVKLNCHPAKIVKLAFDYFEYRLHFKNKLELWDFYQETGFVPSFVLDFCILVLAGNVRITKSMLKRVG